MPTGLEKTQKRRRWRPRGWRAALREPWAQEVAAARWLLLVMLLLVMLVMLVPVELLLVAQVREAALAGAAALARPG